ncbi:MAG: indole-3-glycerol phosphate synthase TrpC [Capnocytophaga sp.]|nr:indole-3-glycerol phosphate synthase TrpC [Capnocytophaga sp.]
MTILDRIVADKYKEIDLKKKLIPIAQLEQSVLYGRTAFSLADNLKKSKNGIIAEHKRRSPSKAVINQQHNCFDVVKAYETAGVSGISVLTDGKYFGGSLDDLLVARASCQLPLLRKDFVVDEYQIHEAKAYGADVILLIAAVLKKEEIKAFAITAKALGLETLLEVHDADELHHSITPEVTMLGVNNRNLKTFEVTIDTSKTLSVEIPDEFVKVSESGISEVHDIWELKKYGYQGFLIGENFMKNDAIIPTTRKFIEEIEKKSF